VGVQVPLRRMLFWSMILGTVLGSTQLLLISGASRTLGLSDQLFVLGDSVVLTVLGQVSLGWGGKGGADCAGAGSWKRVYTESAAGAVRLLRGDVCSTMHQPVGIQGPHAGC
jgi:hypothetical protein